MAYLQPPLSPVSDISDDASPRLASPQKPSRKLAFGTGKLPKNVVAINNDLIQQLVRAPAELTHVYARDGYAGVIRWTERFHHLAESVLRIYGFGLMLEATRAEALHACELCVGLRIPVDDIVLEAARLRAVLDPETFYFDRSSLGSR